MTDDHEASIAFDAAWEPPDKPGCCPDCGGRLDAGNRCPACEPESYQEQAGETAPCWGCDGTGVSSTHTWSFAERGPCNVCGGSGLVAGLPATGPTPDPDPGPVPPDDAPPRQRSAAETMALVSITYHAGDDLRLMCSDEDHRDRPATFALVGPDSNVRVVVGAPAYSFEPLCSACAEQARAYLKTRDE